MPATTMLRSPTRSFSHPPANCIASAPRKSAVNIVPSASTGTPIRPDSCGRNGPSAPERMPTTKVEAKETASVDRGDAMAGFLRARRAAAGSRYVSPHPTRTGRMPAHLHHPVAVGILHQELDSTAKASGWGGGRTGLPA